MEMVFERYGVRTVFTDGSGIYPAYVEMHGRRGWFRTELSMVLEDGREYRPAAPDARPPEALRYRTDHGERLEFHGLVWKNREGVRGGDFRLALRYEFDDSGAVFVNAFFHAEALHAPAIRAFRLTHTLDFAGFGEVRWEHFPWPEPLDLLHIVYNAPERFLPAGEGRVFPGRLMPKVGFMCWGEGGGASLEFFLEGGGALDGCPGNVASRVAWEGRRATLQWDFVAAESRREGVPWQWRNQWGWNLAPARPERALPPLRIFHWFDNFQRYPDDLQIAKMARNGADVLIVHENWREDIQNDGYPHSREELRRTVATAHRHGLRVALYVRGTEVSVDQEGAPWFGHWLTPGRDGLYMDYGSALEKSHPPCEWYPAGQFALREFLERLYRLRARVGEGGILISHTGPPFSTLGMAPHLLDLYVSGECEAGKMVASRELHDYYAATAAGAGSMWTAAFPEYGTAKMVPFLAVAGQSPHVPLGIQFESSSLAHSREPGFESRHLRPLWKLWGLFARQRDILFYNHLNSPIRNGSLMVADDGTALLVLANFGEAEALVAEAPDWARYGIVPRTVLKLQPTEDAPGAPVAVLPDACSVQLAPNGVAGFLVNVAEDDAALQRYLEPYPDADEADVAEERRIAEQCRLREEGVAFPRIFLRVSVPAMTLPYEDSLNLDDYDLRIAFGYFDEANAFQILGWIGKAGLLPEMPERAGSLGNGDASPWMEITGVARPRLGLCTYHHGEPSYSNVRVELSDIPAITPATRTILFVNELEPNRSMLHWANPARLRR